MEAHCLQVDPQEGTGIQRAAAFTSGLAAGWGLAVVCNHASVGVAARHGTTVAYAAIS